MPLSDFLNVQISTAPVGPTLPGFGLPLILGAANAWGVSTDKIRFYQQASFSAAMLADGFVATDPEYLAAQEVFSQNPAPPTVAVGRRTNKPTQKFVLTILQAVVGKVYSVVVNGVVKSYTAIGGDTTANIATGLNTAIGAVTGFGAGVPVGAVITFTATAAGNWARFSINFPTSVPNVDIDMQQTHVDAGIVADITAVRAIDSSWYAVLSTFTGNAEVAALAAYIESNGLLYLAGSQDSTILGAGTADVASTLKTSAYVRSPVWYHPDNGAFLDAAAAGSRLPYTPGSENWMFALPSGVAAYTPTATQLTNLNNKLCNYLYTVSGQNITAKGVTPSGQYIDTVRGRDALAADMQTSIFRALTSPPSASNPANPSGSVLLAKIPFTDPGIAVIEGEVRASLRRFVNSGFLAANPEPTVSVPKASAVSAANKTARNLAPVSFSAVIAGAINGATITGVVTF